LSCPFLRVLLAMLPTPPSFSSRLDDDVLQTSVAHYIWRRASGQTLQRGAVARLHAPPAPISCTHGSYALWWGTPKAYSFDEETREVLDHDGRPVGRWLDRQIAPEPLPASHFSRSGPAARRCVSVVLGEIMEEMQNPANGDAWFVLPSQFNGVEYASHRSIVEKVEEYMGDKTAGPRGQLAAHPAVAQFLLDNAANDDRPGGISALDALLPSLARLLGPARRYGAFLANGYLAMPDCPKQLQPAVLEALRGALHCTRCLGMHGVPASGLTPAFDGLSEAEHRVSLVYASAVPVQAYMNKGLPEQREFQEAVSRLLIAAQYYGALQLAREQGAVRARVVLLPLGGGIFGNSLASIAGAMSDAIEWVAETLPAGICLHDCLDIQVLMYRKNPDDAVRMVELLEGLQKLQEKHVK